MQYDFLDGTPPFKFDAYMTRWLVGQYSQIGKTYHDLDELLACLNDCWATGLLLMLHS